MDWWIQRDGNTYWLYREAGRNTGYRVARFEDREECELFAQWLVVRAMVPDGQAPQDVPPAEGPPGAAPVYVQPPLFT